MLVDVHNWAQRSFGALGVFKANESELHAQLHLQLPFEHLLFYRLIHPCAEISTLCVVTFYSSIIN